MELRRIMSKLREVYYNIKNGISNLLVYFPLIWRTRDWDYYHIYDFLEFKIRKNRECMEKYGIHVGKEKNIHRMKTCELLIKRLKEDDYIYSQHYHGDGEYGVGFYSHYYHPMNSRKENFDLICKLEQVRKKQDKDLLYKILYNNIEKWWD